MNHDDMKQEAISQIVFDEHYAVPGDQTALQLFRHLPLASDYCGQLVDAMATAYLIAVLESICLREVHLHIDQEQETVVGTAVDCRHCALVPAGAMLRVSGWVEQMGDSEVTFRMQAQDEHERVCEASIRLVIVRRDQIAGRITRKREAIERRQLFLAA
jgi:fluoroacetyl-CoA thioesterase